MHAIKKYAYLCSGNKTNLLVMKKILFSLIALMVVMTVQAQSICASWRTVQPVVQTVDDGSLVIQTFMYTFNEDGTFSMADEFTMSSEPAPTMAMEIATNIGIKGTYTLEGDKLTLTPDASTYKAEILSLSMNGKVTSNPMITSQVKSMLNSDEVKTQFAEAQNFTVKVNGDMLEMNDGEETLSLARFSTIQN